MGWGKLFVTFAFFCVFLDCMSAPRIRLQREEVGSINEIWDIQIVSDFRSTRIVNLKVSVYSISNVMLYEAFSDNFVLQSGVSYFNSHNQPLVRVKYSNDRLEELVEGGAVLVEVLMYDPMSYSELTQLRQSVNFKKSDVVIASDSTGGGKKVGEFFDIAGTVELTGLYNTREDTLLYMPLNYFRMQTNHQLKLSGLPFRYEMYVTTEQKHTNQQLNSYTFSFDYESFKHQLIEKLHQKADQLEEKSGVGEYIGEGFPMSKESILDSLRDNGLLKAGYIDKYREYIQIDSMKNYLQIYEEVELKQVISELDSYRRTVAERELSQEDLSRALSEISEEHYKGKMDAVRKVLDTTLVTYDSVFLSTRAKYEDLLKKYNNNRDSLDNFISRMSQYNIGDLLSFSRLNSLVNDKMSSFNKYVNKRDLEQLRSLGDGGISNLEGNVVATLNEKYKILSRRETLLNSLKQFELGTIYPYYTNNTVNGVVLNGYSMGYMYKNIYVSFSGGKQQNIINDSINNYIDLKSSRLFAFAVGYGPKNANHLHLNYSYGSRAFKDRLSDTSFSSKNHIFSPDFAYRFIKDKWAVSGEVPISITSRRRQLKDKNEKVGIATDFRINGDISESTQIEFGQVYYSKDFETYGVPFLFSHYLKYYSKVRQSITSKVRSEFGYSFERFYNYEDINMFSTDFHKADGSVDVILKKWNLHLSYAPLWYFVKEESSTMNFVHNCGAWISSNYTIGSKRQLLSTIGFNYNSFYNTQTHVEDFGSIIIENNVWQMNKSLNWYAVERLSISDKYVLGVNITLQKNNLYSEIENFFSILGFEFTQRINNKFNYTTTLQAIRQRDAYMRFGVKNQISYRINKFLEIGSVLYFDYLDGDVEGRDYHRTKSFQAVSKVIVRI